MIAQVFRIAPIETETTLKTPLPPHYDSCWAENPYLSLSYQSATFFRRYAEIHTQAHAAAHTPKVLEAHPNAFHFVVVVGGGPNGLYMAWRLFLAGFIVVVVEARGEEIRIQEVLFTDFPYQQLRAMVGGVRYKSMSTAASIASSNVYIGEMQRHMRESLGEMKKDLVGDNRKNGVLVLQNVRFEAMEFHYEDDGHEYAYALLTHLDGAIAIDTIVDELEAQGRRVHRRNGKQLLVQMHLLACADGTQSVNCRDRYAGEQVQRSSKTHVDGGTTFLMGDEFLDSPFGGWLGAQRATGTLTVRVDDLVTDLEQTKESIARTRLIAMLVKTHGHARASAHVEQLIEELRAHRVTLEVRQNRNHRIQLVPSHSAYVWRTLLDKLEEKRLLAEEMGATREDLRKYTDMMKELVCEWVGLLVHFAETGQSAVNLAPGASVINEDISRHKRKMLNCDSANTNPIYAVQIRSVEHPVAEYALRQRPPSTTAAQPSLQPHQTDHTHRSGMELALHTVPVLIVGDALTSADPLTGIAINSAFATVERVVLLLQRYNLTPNADLPSVLGKVRDALLECRQRVLETSLEQGSLKELKADSKEVKEAMCRAKRATLNLFLRKAEQRSMSLDLDRETCLGPSSAPASHEAHSADKPPASSSSLAFRLLIVRDKTKWEQVFGMKSTKAADWETCKDDKIFDVGVFEREELIASGFSHRQGKTHSKFRIHLLASDQLYNAQIDEDGRISVVEQLVVEHKEVVRKVELNEIFETVPLAVNALRPTMV
jgi:2-polyprenyl-6-methoxyphenol hydroxylase-like FAD-dependent oxidoreductase